VIEKYTSSLKPFSFLRKGTSGNPPGYALAGNYWGLIWGALRAPHINETQWYSPLGSTPSGCSRLSSEKRPPLLRSRKTLERLLLTCNTRTLYELIFWFLIIVGQKNKWFTTIGVKVKEFVWKIG